MRKARYEALYQGRFAEARRMLDEFAASHPQWERRAIAVLEELRARQEESLRQAFHRVKAEEMDRILTSFLAKRKPDVETAMRFATKEMPAELEAGVRRRLDLSAEDYEEANRTRGTGAPCTLPTHVPLRV